MHRVTGLPKEIMGGNKKILFFFNYGLFSAEKIKVCNGLTEPQNVKSVSWAMIECQITRKMATKKNVGGMRGLRNKQILKKEKKCSWQPPDWVFYKVQGLDKKGCIL